MKKRGDSWARQEDKSDRKKGKEHNMWSEVMEKEMHRGMEHNAMEIEIWKGTTRE